MPGILTLCAVICLIVIPTHSWAQESLLQEEAETRVAPASRWSVETSLTFPTARIYMAKASYRASKKIDLGVGVAFQNWENVETAPRGQSNAWTLLVSYRQYLWRGLHVEAELWPAHNRFESYVDGLTYSGLEMWAEYKVGYVFHLSRRLHVEAELWPAHNRFESYVDGLTYSGLEMWAEYKVGYVFHLSPRLHVIPQPGIGHAVWMQTRWPDFGDGSYGEMVRGSLIFVPQVLVGWRL
jgi:hypothetical protein